MEDLDLTGNAQNYADHVHLEVTWPGAVDSGVLWLELQCAPGQEVLDSEASPR